jgi:hypothetical protein
MNLATIVLRPKQDFSIVLAANVAGTNADDALEGAGRGNLRQLRAEIALGSA